MRTLINCTKRFIHSYLENSMKYGYNTPTGMTPLNLMN